MSSIESSTPRTPPLGYAVASEPVGSGSFFCGAGPHGKQEDGCAELQTRATPLLAVPWAARDAVRLKAQAHPYSP
jgi:hypothetical protein